MNHGHENATYEMTVSVSIECSECGWQQRFPTQQEATESWFQHLRDESTRHKTTVGLDGSANP